MNAAFTRGESVGIRARPGRATIAEFISERQNRTALHPRRDDRSLTIRFSSIIRSSRPDASRLKPPELDRALLELRRRC
jgi:hypothetical protein